MGLSLFTKSRIDKVRLIIFLSYVAVIGVTIVLSLYNVGFDPNKITWSRLLGDVLIASALSIVSMFMALADGRIHFHNTDKHPFRAILNELMSTAWSLIRRGLTFAFTGYAHKEYLERRDEYLLSKLRGVGLQDLRILDLSREEVKSLCSTPILKVINGAEVGFDIITMVQYLFIIELKDGGYKYNETPSDWFLSGVSSKSSDLYQYYARSEKLRKRDRRWRVAYRLVMLCAITIIWAAIAVGDDPFSQQSFVNAALRTFTVIFSIASGYLASKDEVDSEADELNYKKLFIDKFFSDYTSGVYVPPNLTDLVREKLKKLENDSIEIVQEDPHIEESVDAS